MLLAGVPGDVESENDYREQLQGWLEIVGGSGQAEKLFVLCDRPESVALPQDGKASVLKADRTNFLSLGPKLAGQTNPLVVIAWGHGGKQGSQPVFHVRGPRLTPADFKALADRSPTAESRWLLVFRGSGTFASQLAAPRRQILSSECETMFTSDPVGMALLLKLARAEPALSFEAMSQELGRATAAWYRERNLARTEEPTLWVADQKPRLLAAANTDSSASPAPKEANEAAVKGEPAERQNEPAEPKPMPPDLPAHWKTLQRVEPQKYPEADAVSLRRRLSYTFGSNPAIVTEQDEFIQILTPEGKRYGDFDISYSPPFEDITFQDCEVLRPDGKLERLEPDAIREAQEAAAGDYQRGRRKFFSMPGVVPGAVLHVRYRTQWKQFPLPSISMAIPVGQELPTLDATIEVSVPKESPFHYVFEQVSAPDPVLNRTDYGVTYSWRLVNVPAQRHELLAFPRQQPELLLSTFPDWQAFADWYTRISKLADEVTPEIAAKAKELTREAKTDRERVLAIYNYVTGLRYVAVPLGVNSFRPHAAAHVLQNQYGDCKDKANLFNTLLHALNIDAHLVLVPRFRQAYDAVPGLAFNHAISRVTLGGETVWVDTTEDVCRFGLLPPGDPGRNVLVIDGQSSSLTRLPAPQPSEHQLKLHGQVTCSGSAGAWPVSLSAVASGYPDYELRMTAQEARQHRAALPLLAAKFRPATGSFALERQSATSVSALDDNFTWQAEGACIGIASTEGGKQLLHSPFWLPKEWDLALHSRKTPLFLNQGYPLTLEEEFEFALPPQAQPIALPGVSENKAAPLQWRIEWNKSGDKLTARFRAELARGELAEADTSALQKQLRELLAALASSASFSVQP